jgi:phosphoglycolate phosphatase-like HAD superfamily hydrolase
MEKTPGLDTRRESFTSRVEKSDGTFEALSIKMEKDGKPKLFVFEDIDKTLLHLEPTYMKIREAMWPEAAKKEGIELVSKVHLDGFRLGTMWRELYRMHGIYSLGRDDWRDSNFYEQDFLAPGKAGEHIDKPGDPLHEEADKMLQKFDDIAAQVVEAQAKADPDFFKNSKIKPMFKLNAIYKRLGVPVVGMSANPRKFIEAICKHTGLAEQFLDCATDTDVPGTKEFKMRWLAARAEENGLHVPYDRLLVIGDSALGDVGSASRFQQLAASEHPEVSAAGILIVDNEKDIAEGVRKLEGVRDIDVRALDYKKVPFDDKGVPILGSGRRDEFLTQIKQRES